LILAAVALAVRCRTQNEVTRISGDESFNYYP
jgi:hypothetical protein